MRGRKPVPPKLKLVLGQRVSGTPLPASSGTLEPPKHLTDEQREVWIETVGRAPAGLLQPDHALMLEQLCVREVRRRKLDAMAEKRGLAQRDRSHGGMPRVAWWVKQARAESAAVRALLRDLGLTPLARSAIYLPPPSDGELSEFEKLMGG